MKTAILFLLTLGLLFLFSCGGDECAQSYESLSGGVSMLKDDSLEMALSADGCPSGCSSVSETCCWCPD